MDIKAYTWLSIREELAPIICASIYAKTPASKNRIALESGVSQILGVSGGIGMPPCQKFGTQRWNL